MNSKMVIIWSVFIGFLIGAICGLFIGIVIGVNSAFSETDGLTEVVYSSDASLPAPNYWYVYLNEQKQPMLRSTDESPFDIESVTNYIVPIGINGRAEVGVAVGETGFDRASARFFQMGNSTEVAVRVHNPDGSTDGWPFVEYKYTVDENELMLFEVERIGSPFNEWGGEMVFYTAIAAAFFGSITGGIAGGTVGFLIQSNQHSKEN
jgi:hypothetical protein